ncbi:hypothetical protein MHI37_30290 [Paenibacillus sp. FSL H8-0548]|uniref:hypothetical protein n=1 Tax=Paenibacillus sp. FSL H8-0548 TaxID=1920422 RepID=UPI00117FF580
MRVRPIEIEDGFRSRTACELENGDIIDEKQWPSEAAANRVRPPKRRSFSMWLHQLLAYSNVYFQ